MVNEIENYIIYEIENYIIYEIENYIHLSLVVVYTLNGKRNGKLHHIYLNPDMAGRL